jgi:GT2 family glycosyltransferase
MPADPWLLHGRARQAGSGASSLVEQAGSIFAFCATASNSTVAAILLIRNEMALESAQPMNPADAGAVPRQVGMVVIGRNEGARLVRCLQSCALEGGPIVYVDSGSTDGSPEAARALGAHVLALDMTIPFTAARARNEGFAALAGLHPRIDRIQFLDGDCELVSGWIAAASGFLDAHPEVAAACGRRVERFPEASIYNRLCDIEWNTPIGQARAFGGDVLIRANALTAVRGYRADLIAGEEPELCVRLRAAGWMIWRLQQDMTWHDAAMTRWTQWWRRNVRAGHAFAEGAWLHGAAPERHFVGETRRALLWGAALPLALLVATLARPALAWLWLVYPLQWARVALRLRGQGRPLPWTQSAFFLQGRFAEAAGALRFWWGRTMERRSALIEYK